MIQPRAQCETHTRTKCISAVIITTNSRQRKRINNAYDTEPRPLRIIYTRALLDTHNCVWLRTVTLLLGEDPRIKREQRQQQREEQFYPFVECTSGWWWWLLTRAIMPAMEFSIFHNTYYSSPDKYLTARQVRNHPSSAKNFNFLDPRKSDTRGAIVKNAKFSYPPSRVIHIF